MTIAIGHSRPAIGIKCSSPEAAQHLASVLMRRNPKWVVEVNDKQVSVILRGDMSVFETIKEMIK